MILKSLNSSISSLPLFQYWHNNLGCREFAERWSFLKAGFNEEAVENNSASIRHIDLLVVTKYVKQPGQVLAWLHEINNYWIIFHICTNVW